MRVFSATALIALLAACESSPTSAPSAGTLAGPSALAIRMVPGAPIVGQSTSFTDGVQDRSDLSRTWTFSDGTTAEGSLVERSFTEPGKYWVHLVVSDGGATRSVTLAFEVTLSCPWECPAQP